MSNPPFFYGDEARKVIAYVKGKYGDELEFLWPKSPMTSILRRKDTSKWYAALLNLPQSKLGLASRADVDIINLRAEPSEVAALVDGERYFPAWHMNKRHWITICLDGSIPVEEICERIDASYRLAKK